MFKKATLTVLAAVALAGCVTSSGTNYNVVDPYLFFSRAARGGNFPVMIVGEPYPGRQPAVEAQVLSSLDRSFKSFGNPFKVVPPANSLSSRLVIVFNAPGRPLPQTSCANTTTLGGGVAPSAGGTLSASAVYCGDGPYSSTWISVDAPASPDSAEFAAAMDILIREALPRDPNPSERHGRDEQLPPT